MRVYGCTATRLVATVCTVKSAGEREAGDCHGWRSGPDVGEGLEEGGLAGSAATGPGYELGPAVGPVGEGGSTWSAQGVAPKHRDEGEFIGYGDLAVAEVTDPQRIVMRDTGDDRYAQPFEVGSYTGLGGGPPAVGLPVSCWADDEAELVPAAAADTLCGHLGLDTRRRVTQPPG